MYNHSIPSMHAERKIIVHSHNTLLLHFSLLALTQPQMEIRRNKSTLVGLGNLRFLQVKTDKSKTYLFSFGGKLLTDKNCLNFFRSIFFNPTHHFLCFCLFFLSVPMDWVGKRCGRKLGGQFGQFITKSQL